MKGKTFFVRDKVDPKDGGDKETHDGEYFEDEGELEGDPNKGEINMLLGMMMKFPHEDIWPQERDIINFNLANNE